MKNKRSRRVSVPSDTLLAAARHLFKTGHKACPFMMLDSGPDGCSLSMKFKTLDDGQAVHAALVRFFTANPAVSLPRLGAGRAARRCWAS